MMSIVADISALAGPALSGLVMVSLGFNWILWIDCATFAVNAATLIWLISSSQVRLSLPTFYGGAINREVDGGGSDSGFIAGLRLIPSFRWFGFGLLLWFVISSGIGVVAVAGPVIAVKSLGGPYAWAVLSTCLAVGSLFGSVVVASSVRSFPWWQAAALVTLGFCTQLTALMCRKTLGLALSQWCLLVRLQRWQLAVRSGEPSINKGFPASTCHVSVPLKASAIQWAYLLEWQLEAYFRVTLTF
jgi:hypothetical protein